MSHYLKGAAAGTLLVLTLVFCKGGSDAVDPRTNPQANSDPMFTMSSGSSSTLLGRATFSDTNNQTFDIKRITGDWQMQIKSKPAFDIAVQRIKFLAGGQSGWHTHPGPVFIQVVYGTMTFYQADDPTCSPIVRTAGQGYIDLGEHPHIAVNETSDSSINVVTYFAPPGSVLKFDANAPGNCSF